MYACIHETGAGFFAAVRGLEDQPLTCLRPSHPTIRELTHANLTTAAGRFIG
jgi:hypothetical protein